MVTTVAATTLIMKAFMSCQKLHHQGMFSTLVKRSLKFIIPYSIPGMGSFVWELIWYKYCPRQRAHAGVWRRRCILL
eukprot:3345472-Amphidinium_carterae.2